MRAAFARLRHPRYMLAGGARLAPEHPASDRAAPLFRNRSVLRRRALATLAELFASGDPAWVLLAQLPEKIQRDLGITRDNAFRALRPAFESFAIRTEVVNWNHWLPGGTQSVEWAEWCPERYVYRVAEEGWGHVDWEAGRLNGCVIRVLWRDIERELAPLAAAHRNRVTAEAMAPTSRGFPKELVGDPRAQRAFNVMLEYAHAQVALGRRPQAR